MGNAFGEIHGRSSLFRESDEIRTEEFVLLEKENKHSFYLIFSHLLHSIYIFLQ